MDTAKQKPGAVMRLRPHHICCIPRWTKGFPERGPGFQQREDEIKKTFSTSAKTMVEAAEGTDILCQECPLRADDRCASPLGDETEVRKWDFLLLRELGLPYGTCLPAAQWRKLIEKKAPFKLCRKCRWRPICPTGGKTPEFL